MKAAMDVITSGKKQLLYKSIFIHVIYDFFRILPFIFLILILWNILSSIIDYGLIFLYICAIALMYGIQYLLTITALVSVNRSGYKMCSKARLKLGEHLRTLSMGFFKGRDPGDITQIMLHDMSMVESIFTRLLPDIVAALVIPLVLLIVFYFLDWRLTTVILLTILLSVPVIFISKKILKTFGLTFTQAQVETGSRLLEYLTGIRYIKAYNLTGDKFKVLDVSFKKFHSAAIKTVILPSALGSCYASLLGIGYVILLLSATYYYLDGSLPAITYLVFIILGLQVYQPLIDAGHFIGEARFLNLAAERMKEVMDCKPLPEPDFPIVPDKYGITFDHVSFHYHEKKVLDDVNFSVSPGEVLALVGPSGSGKTTITNLIARFWDIKSGRITIGGIDIKKIGSDNLYSCISMVFQDVYLFNDTIKNNIRIGKPGATDEEIIQAASQAQAHEFINKLPKGYDTLIGEAGATLSGGEKQRISIARALLKNAPIILLDEATTSVDPENEQKIQEAVSALIASKTVIVIAHRLNTIRNADKILVLENGRVTDIGKHEELLSRKGMYFRMWKEQEKAGSWSVTS